MLGVFIDTFIVLTLTALVILTSGVYTPGGPVQGAALTQAGFSVSFGSFGAPFIALCLFFFAYSSILGWHFFGAANLHFLFGNRGLRLYQAGACLWRRDPNRADVGADGPLYGLGRPAQPAGFAAFGPSGRRFDPGLRRPTGLPRLKGAKKTPRTCKSAQRLIYLFVPLAGGLARGQIG